MKFLFSIALLLVTLTFVAAQKQTFSIGENDFLLNGKPFLIKSGEMHYPRVPRAYWRDRMRKARTLGLNTITTYVFWNLHEKEPGKFDFTGNLDVAAFVRDARAEGLFVILRPGPYVCTEWDFGGIPSWLLREKDMQVRTKDPRFLKANAAYMKKVAEQIKPLQVTNGGNVIMVQVENEYGSFGDDHEYMAAIKNSIIDAGFDVPLFTSDGPNDRLLKGGTLPDVASVINFAADDDILAQFKTFAEFRPKSPKMVGEYWVGWFDHWGEKHHTVPAETVARGVETFLKNNISFNLYMFHGGATFGFMAGANYSRRSPYEPDTSAYDYDSPLDDAGRVTPKYKAVREVISRYLPTGENLPDVPDTTRMIAIPPMELDESAGIESLLRNPVRAERTLAMEDLRQNHGFVLYRTRITEDFKGKLSFEKMNDYAHLYRNGEFFAKLDRRLKENSLEVVLSKGDTFDVLVENMGRLNFGKEFIYDRKGIIGEVRAGDRKLTGWEMFSLPMEKLSSIKFSSAASQRPVFFRRKFRLEKFGDTYIDMRGWGKGHVWINGNHLGRFWKIGPQQTLYCPAVWLKRGVNEIVVLDLENNGNRKIQSLTDPVYGN